MQYSRTQIKGGTNYFTLVTNNRAQHLTKPGNISSLRESFKYVKKRHPFKIDTIVKRPDHLHSIWTLPEGDYNFSKPRKLIKSNHTMKSKEKKIYDPPCNFSKFRCAKKGTCSVAAKIPGATNTR